MLSKRWAGVLQGSTPPWAALSIDEEEEYRGEAQPNATAMAAWFSRRAGSIIKLNIMGDEQKVPPALIATLLMTQAASLTSLRLDLGAARLSSADLCVLAALSHLKDFGIRLPEAPSQCWGAGVIDTLSQLPALEILLFSNPGDSDVAPGALPTLKELAALRSPTLSELGMALSGEDDETLALGSLPALNSCGLLFISSEAHVCTEILHHFKGRPASQTWK